MTGSDGARAWFIFDDALAPLLASFARGRRFEHCCARAATLKQAIESLGVPHTETGRIVVNGAPATLSRIVRDGDAIEVYAPRPADDVGPMPAFIADAHLGGLARLLRMLGFDTLYDNHYADPTIIEIASREPRTILTRDLELLKSRDVLRGAFVRARKPEAQLRETVARFGLLPRARPFSLCLHCNLALQAVPSIDVAPRIPAAIAARYAAFRRCPGCERVYWPGSHWLRMRDMLNAALDSEPGMGGRSRGMPKS